MKRAIMVVYETDTGVRIERDPSLDNAVLLSIARHLAEAVEAQLDGRQLPGARGVCMKPVIINGHGG